MANDALNTPVAIKATGLTASSLPPGVSPAYQQYILSQASDLAKVASKANDAGDGAYDSQIRNDQQDAQLLDHEIRLGDAEAKLQSHATRLTSAEAAIVSLNGRVAAAESDITFLTDELIAIHGDITTLQNDVSDQGGRITQAETDIDNLQADYVSKKALSAQVLLSPLGVATSLSINGVKVLGPKQTGWTAGTGTANLGAFNADLSLTVGAAYSQSEVQTIANELVAARRRILALEKALRTHGQIN